MIRVSLIHKFKVLIFLMSLSMHLVYGSDIYKHTHQLSLMDLIKLIIILLG